MLFHANLFFSFCLLKGHYDSSFWCAPQIPSPPAVGTFLAHVYCRLLYMHVFWLARGCLKSSLWQCQDPFCKNRCLQCYCIQTFQLQLVCRIVWVLLAGLCLLTQVSWLVIKRGLDTLACKTVCWYASLFFLHLFVTINLSFHYVKILIFCESTFWHCENITVDKVIGATRYSMPYRDL